MANEVVKTEEAVSDKPKKAKKEKVICAKECEVMNYVEYFKEPIMDIIKRFKTIKKYAFILHDKDYHIGENGEKVYEENPHYHIYLNFGRASVPFPTIAKWFGQEVQYVNKVVRTGTMLEYLTHSNDSQQYKHQYSPDEVYSNFDFVKEAEIEQNLGDFEHYSYAQQIEFVHSLPLDKRLPAMSKLKKFWELECRYRSLQSERDIEVVFIEGLGGSGKTTYAKELFRKRGFDFCMSSSSNDPLQDYSGQNGLLLDDLRDRVMFFEDLLKVTDNHNQSSMSSRFMNKIFVGKLIVITSSVSLSKWYRRDIKRNGQSIRLDNDDLWQLYRRISCYIVMTKDEITVYNEGLNEFGRPKGLGVILPNSLGLRFKAEEKKKTDFAALMSEITSECGQMKIDVGPFNSTDIK